jgi:hypothetical protein
MQKRQSDSEERLLRATALSQTLCRDDWLLDHVQKIVSEYQAVKRGSFWWFKLRADETVVQCRNVLHSLGEGYMMADPRSALNFGMEVSQRAEKAMKATDLGRTAFAWWRGTGGQAFVQANGEAVQRKVRVTRVFIQPIGALRGGIDVLEKQASLGIEVYVAQPEELSRELCEDYMIVDDQVVSRTTFSDSGEPHEERISTDQVEVQRMAKNFDLLLRQAKKLDDVVRDLKQ